MIEFSKSDLVITLQNFDVDQYCKLLDMLVFAYRTVQDDSNYYPNMYLIGVLIEELLPSPDHLKKPM